MTRDLPQALLALQRTLQRCRSVRELRFSIVNDALPLFQYEQAALAEPGLGGRPCVTAVSGLAELDSTAPYIQWLERVTAWVATRGEKILNLAPDQLPVDIADAGVDWLPHAALACCLFDPSGKLTGVLWFTRLKVADDAELAAAEWLADAAGYALWAWRAPRRSVAEWLREQFSGRRARIALGVVVVCVLFPVRLSVLAPAEITPVAPTPLTAPTDGVVQRVMVTPNQRVKAGDLLVVLDDTATRNRLLVAQKSLEIAKADFQRATSKSFADDAAKAELQLLDARMREKVAEVGYLAELLERIRMTAPRDGIAIFADPLDWLGKPVQTGERIMMLADPAAVELTIQVPADDAIELEAGAPVRMFLNISPLTSLDAIVTQTSYEVATTANNTLAYLLMARLTGVEHPRLGLKGTAKLYAGYVPLSYYLLRRPLGVLRRASGF